MRFGDLRHLVTIKRDVSSRGPSGALKPWISTADVATVFGHLETNQTNERFGGPDYPVSITNCMWTIHDRSDVTPKMRIYFGSRVFEITAVPRVPGDQFLQLPCVEIV